MVTVSNYLERENEKGEKFFVLVLLGEPEIIKSKTGNFYATARSANIPASFEEAICKSMIGKKLPGRIIKEECQEYDYKLESGEIIKRNHTYRYSDEKTVEEVLFEEEAE
jgi:hypothetical protein